MACWMRMGASGCLLQIKMAYPTDLADDAMQTVSLRRRSDCVILRNEIKEERPVMAGLSGGKSRRGCGTIERAVTLR